MLRRKKGTPVSSRRRPGGAPTALASSGDGESDDGRRWSKQSPERREKEIEEARLGFVDPGSSLRTTARATRVIEALDEYYECAESDSPKSGRNHAKRGEKRR